MWQVKGIRLGYSEKNAKVAKARELAAINRLRNAGKF
jgi:hypothetical protein